MSACSFTDGYSAQLTKAQQQQQTFCVAVGELPTRQRVAATRRVVSSCTCLDQETASTPLPDARAEICLIGFHLECQEERSS